MLFQVKHFQFLEWEGVKQGLEMLALGLKNTLYRADDNFFFFDAFFITLKLVWKYWV